MSIPKHKIVNIIAAPEDFTIIYKDGDYERAVCLGLMAGGDVIPMLNDEDGIIRPATDDPRYYGFYSLDEQDGIIEALPPYKP